MRKTRNLRKKKATKNVASSIIFITVMLVFVGIFTSRINSHKKEDAELEAKENAYRQMNEKESERTSELEDRKVRVTTKEYIEEEAREFGLVYPDEIIFKPEPKE